MKCTPLGAGKGSTYSLNGDSYVLSVTVVSLIVATSSIGVTSSIVSLNKAGCNGCACGNNLSVSIIFYSVLLFSISISTLNLFLSYTVPVLHGFRSCSVSCSSLDLV